MEVPKLEKIVINVGLGDIKDNPKSLENAVNDWTNVLNQTYTLGTTVFKDNAYTGCSSYNLCATNTYTLTETNAKARLITLQELEYLGCTDQYSSCPIWLYNYLEKSIDYGGTINTNEGSDIAYWTSSAFSDNKISAWDMYYTGSVYCHECVNNHYTSHLNGGVRPVIAIEKWNR